MAPHRTEKQGIWGSPWAWAAFPSSSTKLPFSEVKLRILCSSPVTWGEKRKRGQRSGEEKATSRSSRIWKCSEIVLGLPSLREEPQFTQPFTDWQKLIQHLLCVGHSSRYLRHRTAQPSHSVLFFGKKNFCLFVLGCSGSLWLCRGFL